MARKKAVKKYTLTEFKAWLEGIEEIQPNDWHPDPAQWKMIRERIGGIVEPPPPKPVPVPAPAATLPPAGMQHEPRPAPRPGQIVLEPSALNTVTGDVQPSGAAGGPQPDITPAAKAALQGKLPKEIATDPNQGSKTANIDTSQGDYQSSFT